MMNAPSPFRRMFDFAAILAMLHLIGLVSLVGYLVNNGSVTSETASQIVMLLRGEDPIKDEESKENESDALPVGINKENESAFVASQTDMEILQLEAQRIKTELDQRLALNNSILLRAMTEREAFKKERQTAKNKDWEENKHRKKRGYQKQIAIYDSLAPKVAVQHLLNLKDPDEAARILLEMDTRKAKKIIESAKTFDQMNRMQDIMQRIRNVVPKKFDELNTNEK